VPRGVKPPRSQLLADEARDKREDSANLSDGHSGVIALNTQGGRIAAYRGNERFPMTGAFKFTQGAIE
jgi:beta-lactamase class A